MFAEIKTWSKSESAEKGKVRFWQKKCEVLKCVFSIVLSNPR